MTWFFEVSIAYDLAEELEFIEDRVHRAVEQAAWMLHTSSSIHISQNLFGGDEYDAT